MHEGQPLQVTGLRTTTYSSWHCDCAGCSRSQTSSASCSSRRLDQVGVVVVVVRVLGYTRPVFQHDDDVDLSQAELSREICLKLSETDTMWILDMPSICVMSDSDEALEIVRRNKCFDEQVTDLFFSF